MTASSPPEPRLGLARGCAGSARRPRAAQLAQPRDRACGRAAPAAWAAAAWPAAGRTRTRSPAGPTVGHRARDSGRSAAAISRPERRWAPGGGSQPSISARLRRARTAAIAAASRRSRGVAKCTLLVATSGQTVLGGQRGQRVVGRRVGRAGRGRSSRPPRGRGRTARSAVQRVPRRRASGPAAGSAAVSGPQRPLRQPVRTSQCPPARSRQLLEVVERDGPSRRRAAAPR